jgi:hypothetical protein
MENLIEKISINAEIDRDKATEALRTISEHVKEQFPLLASVVDLILGTKNFSHQISFKNDLLKNQITYN